MTKRKSRLYHEIGDEVFVKCTDGQIRIGTITERLISVFFPGRDININANDRRTLYYYRIQVNPNNPNDQKEVEYIKTLNNGGAPATNEHGKPVGRYLGTNNGTTKGCAIYRSEQISKFRPDLEK
ncbi:hypothetical protein EBU71_21610 [bacterium]|nr:hypothetical protein [Candidatus Elulimicrobium humile]